MRHGFYAPGVYCLHLGDQAKDIIQLGLGGFEFFVVHRQSGKAGDFFDIG